jgi:diguanylate cyclase (GGDEF)-like protein
VRKLSGGQEPFAVSGRFPDVGRTDDGRTDDGRTEDGRTEDGRTRKRGEEMLDHDPGERPLLLDPTSEFPVVPLLVALYLAPALHPLLRPMVGPPSHLLWWIHVLPVGQHGHRHGRWGMAGAVAASVVLAGVGERAFGAGYAVAADWETVWSITLALGFTNVLVGAFALYARSAREWLVHNAFHDALTGLPNRELLLDRLDRLVERAGRLEDASFAALYLDLDRFKVVNDSMGHRAGDQLLISIADRLREALRGADGVGRIGGDEFVVLLEDVSRPAEVVRVAERIQQILDAPFRLGEGEHETFVSASIGIATSESDYDDPEDVLRDADIAMYRAKERGRGEVAVFDQEMHERVRTLMSLQTALRHGVEREEYRVFYQPIVDLADGRIRSLEALVRWEHPERGLLAPGEFLEAAEETGLIVPIGYQVLERAAARLARWRERFPHRQDLSVSVNLSAGQLTSGGLCRRLREVLGETGLDSGALELEVTETEMMTAVRGGGGVMDELKELGFRIAVDDFGTGYSSLSYLHTFPVDTLKVDRSFVSCLGCGDPRDRIVEAVIRLAEGLEPEAVARRIARRIPPDPGDGPGTADPEGMP